MLQQLQLAKSKFPGSLELILLLVLQTVSLPSSPTRGGFLTVESPVGYRRHGDAALEHGALREKQEGGEESTVGLGVKQHGASTTQ